MDETKTDEPAAKETKTSDQRMEQIAAARLVVIEAESDYLEKKEEAKRANDTFSAAQTRLMLTIDEDPEPLFDSPPSKNGAADTDVADDSWRDADIDGLGLADGVVNALREAGLDTIRKIGDYTEKGGRLIDVKGVGKSKVDKISDALEQYFAEMQQKQMFDSGETEADEAGETDPPDTEMRAMYRSAAMNCVSCELISSKDYDAVVKHDDATKAKDTLVIAINAAKEAIHARIIDSILSGDVDAGEIKAILAIKTAEGRLTYHDNLFE